MSPKDDMISDFEKEMGVDFGFEDVPEEMKPEEKNEVVELKEEVVEEKPKEDEEVKPEDVEVKPDEKASDDNQIPKEDDKEQVKAESETVEEKEEEYVPNFKYSVKGKEMEIPEYLRASVTDSKSEEQVRDIMTKLDGFDGIKSARDEALEKLDGTSGELNNHKQYFDYLNNMVISKDLDNFFKEANLSEDDILKHAEKILDRRELPQEEQLRIQRENQARIDMYNTKQELNTQKSVTSEQEEKLANLEINAVFSREDVMAAEKELDSRLGEGSFRQVVGEIGNAVFGTDKELSVLEATQKAIARFGLGEQQVPQTTKQKKAINPNVEQRVVVNKNEMPSVGSGSSSESVVSKELTPEDLDRMEEEALSGRLRR